MLQVQGILRRKLPIGLRRLGGRQGLQVDRDGVDFAVVENFAPGRHAYERIGPIGVQLLRFWDAALDLGKELRLRVCGDQVCERGNLAAGDVVVRIASDAAAC